MGLGCQSEPKVVSNGSPGNYCKVSNEHVIGHVLVGQNEGSTSTMKCICRTNKQNSFRASTMHAFKYRIVERFLR